jgi:pilus assembly protein Flp/PilA
MKRGDTQMVSMFMNALVAVRAVGGSVANRTGSERGASMVEYALLVGLIAVVAVVAIAALGGGISHLFNSANSSVGNATGNATP